MKLKITITGPKVHDVGYRYLLLGGAMGLHIPGFYAANLVELEKQIIQPGFAVQFRQMQVDIRAIKERLGMP